MLEKRKEESDSIGKYQGIVTSCVIAAVIIWLAPLMIPVLTGNPDQGLFSVSGNATSIIPAQVVSTVDGLLNALLWFARIILVFAVIIAVVMLQIRRP